MDGCLCFIIVKDQCILRTLKTLKILLMITAMFQTQHMIFLPRKHLLEDRAFEYYHQKDFLFYNCQNPVPNQIFSMPFYVSGKLFWLMWKNLTRLKVL
jgi:hypothetical protein